jgi:hypothetical protein
MRAYVLLALGSIVAAGCGSPPPAPTAREDPDKAASMFGGGAEGLATFGTVYRSFQDAHGRAPTGLPELSAHALDVSRPLPPGTTAFEVAWGTGMGELCRDPNPGAVVVASAPPTAGGVPVLTADGRTRVMPQDEFWAAKRAGNPRPRNGE